MKFSIQIALASLTLVLVSLMPVSAQEVKTASGHRAQAQTYHDRTPRVRIHGSHPRRG